MTDEQVRDVPDPPRVDGLPGPRAPPSTRRRRSARRSPRRSPILGQSASEGGGEALLRRCDRVQIADPERWLSAIRTSSRAGCSSASSSPSRSPRTRSSSSSTSRRPGSTRRSRRACSTSSASLQAETNAAVLLIAHNLGVIRTLCDRVGVMYAGKIVEEGDAAAVFEHPEHPYTLGLLRSLPRHGVRKIAAGAVDDPGQPAPDRDRPADLRLRRPLPTGRRAVPDGRAAGRRARCAGAGRAAIIATGWARSSSRRPGRRPGHRSTATVP